MDTLRFSLLAICSLGRAVAATPALPLSFEQRGTNLFFAHTGSTSIRFQTDRVTIGDVTLRFEHARPNARIEGIGPASPANYIGASATRTFSQYPKLAVRGLYPGTDAVFYGNAGNLEYDLNVAPGASPASLRLRFENARRLRLGADGNLIVEGAGGELQQLPPRVVQSHRRVRACYVLTGSNEAAIRLGKYDRRRPLTIDPVLVYAKYFGGSDTDSANLVATDNQGNVYVAGRSNSRDFPTLGGASSEPTPPLIALTAGGQSIAPVNIANANSATAIGGTPDGQILYAAAGRTVYYSSDAGATWRATAAIPAATFQVLSPPLAINDISVDAFDPSRAFVATNRGMFSTGDNGGHWFPRDFGLAANYDGSIQAVSVTISQMDHTVMYATTGMPNFLYKSVNAGGTWTILNPAYPGEPAPPAFSSPTIYTLAPGGSDLYAIDGNGLLLKSSDGGGAWQKLAGGLFNARTIALDASSGANIYVQDNSGVQKSTDGGLTFATVNPPGVMQGNAVTGLAYDAVSQTLYTSASGSIFASVDQGVTWQVAPLSPVNIHTLQAIAGRVFVALDTPQTTFLVKFGPTGSRLLYSTFFTDKPMDFVVSLQVDLQGSAYLAGTTISQSFAGVTKIFGSSSLSYFNAFVAKVTPDGSSLAYLAAFKLSKGMTIGGLAIDSSGDAYLTGLTASPDFPTTPDAFQSKLPTTTCTRPQDSRFPFYPGPNLPNHAFATKISPDGGSLIYSTYVTGSCGSVGQGIVVNAAGEAFVGGSTTSPDMPVSTNAYQAVFPGPLDKTGYPDTLTAGFALHLSAAGDKVLGGTFIGGGYVSGVTALALDSAGNPVLTGYTWGIANGATPGAYQTGVIYRCAEPISIGPGLRQPSQGDDAFVLKLDPTLSQAAYLTYLGGSCADSASAIAIDPSGNIWIAGNTSSGDFPLNAPYQLNSFRGDFVSELGPDGAKLLFSSFTDGAALAVDPQGFVYVAGSSALSAINKSSASNQPTSASLVKIDPKAAAPAIIIDKIASISVDSRSLPQPFFSSTVAPGEFIRITGHKLGPASKVNAQLDSSGTLQTTVAGTEVLFDGIAAPLIAVQDSEIDCFVPFEVSQVSVLTAVVGGQRSNSVRTPVQPSQVEILAIATQDGSLNSTTNPAPQGSVVVVYVSGLGQTNPPSIDGKINAAPAAVPTVGVNAFVGGMPELPQYVAAAVGLVAGISQVNLLVPVQTYPSTPTSITVNGAAAPLYVVK